MLKKSENESYINDGSIGKCTIWTHTYEMALDLQKSPMDAEGV